MWNRIACSRWWPFNLYWCCRQMLALPVLGNATLKLLSACRSRESAPNASLRPHQLIPLPPYPLRFWSSLLLLWSTHRVKPSQLPLPLPSWVSLSHSYPYRRFCRLILSNQTWPLSSSCRRRLILLICFDRYVLGSSLSRKSTCIADRNKDPLDRLRVLDLFLEYIYYLLFLNFEVYFHSFPVRKHKWLSNRWNWASWTNLY